MNPMHDSMRGWFAAALEKEMARDERVWLLTGDLGYKMLDSVRDRFPARFVNCGAAEQVMVGAAVGLALSGKVPFCYSVTPFLLCRPFEWLRNYLEHELVPVKLVGAGRDADYGKDGFTHHAFDASRVLRCFPNIQALWPKAKEEVPALVDEMVINGRPCFLSLSR